MVEAIEGFCKESASELSNNDREAYQGNRTLVKSRATEERGTKQRDCFVPTRHSPFPLIGQGENIMAFFNGQQRL